MKIEAAPGVEIPESLLRAAQVDMGNTREENLVGTLRRIDTMMEGRSLQSFVLKHGKLYKAAKRPKGIRKRAYRECFKNAYQLAQQYGYTYVEGYALNIIEVLHAWCVDQEGNVIDDTWLKPQQCVYFGIPLKIDFVTRGIVNAGVYGVLADPEIVSRMDKLDAKEWRVL